MSQSIPIALSGLMLVTTAACGGKLDSDEDRRPAERERPAAEKREERKDVDPSGLPKQPLGPCELGFDPTEEPERPCNWVAEGRCYTKKLDACNCACPRDSGDTTCVSDFPGENGRVPVSCF